MRRRVMLTGMALAGLTAAGCSNGGSGGGSGEDVDISDTEMEATIEFAAWEADFAWDAVIAGFNEKYPNITVQITKSPFKDFFTRLQTQASGDNLPDAFMMNGPNFQLYASHDMLVSFESAVDAGELDFGNYPEAMENLYTYEDVPYGVPTSYDSIGLWYNEELFEQAGVEVPTDEWTWGGHHPAAKEISAGQAGEGGEGVARGGDNH
ncbi:MAG: extracellular solute-binding protein, partial [Brachybacterium sp.]|uniref:ABC transporter substrate-binding protein n=1 Tax=Brachybacterium sp. TaxID=1891286 RepID=UPI0026490A67